MNRRNFLKSTGVASIALLAPNINLLSNIPAVTYKDFEWLKLPSGFLFKTVNTKLVDCPYSVKSWRLKTQTSEDVDLSLERIYTIGEYSSDKYCSLFMQWSINTNSILLTECKQEGFSHLLCILSVKIEDLNGKLYTGYIARGLKMPDWKCNTPLEIC